LAHWEGKEVGGHPLEVLLSGNAYGGEPKEKREKKKMDRSAQVRPIKIVELNRKIKRQTRKPMKDKGESEILLPQTGNR